MPYNLQVPYGVVEVAEDGTVENMREKPNFSFLTNTGVYVVEPEVLDEIEDNTFIGFPDIIKRCKNKGMKIGVYPIGAETVGYTDIPQASLTSSLRFSLLSTPQIWISGIILILYVFV